MRSRKGVDRAGVPPLAWSAGRRYSPSPPPSPSPRDWLTGGLSFRYSTFPSAFTVTTGLAHWRPLLQVQYLPLRLHRHHGTGSLEASPSGTVPSPLPSPSPRAGSLEAPPSGTVPSPPPSPSPRDWLTGGPSFRYSQYPLLYCTFIVARGSVSQASHGMAFHPY